MILAGSLQDPIAIKCRNHAGIIFQIPPPFSKISYARHRACAKFPRKMPERAGTMPECPECALEENNSKHRGYRPVRQTAVG